MDSDTTEDLIVSLNAALVEVAEKKEAYETEKWALTIAAFIGSGIAIFFSISSHIVSNRCWNMLSPTTKASYGSAHGSADISHG